jgi:4-hydroxy-tetrahydrodipicolinate synthase
MFKGSFPALITPFRDGGVDETAFRKLVDWQIAEGSDGWCPAERPANRRRSAMPNICGSWNCASRRPPGGFRSFAGTGSNSTAEAILLTRHAKEAGADGALIVTPYYNKPMQEGMYRHFKAIHDAVEIPIVIYNIPGRSVVDMSVETMARLAELPNIVGVKDATQDLVRPLATRIRIGNEFLPAFGRGCDGAAAAGQPAATAASR